MKTHKVVYVREKEIYIGMKYLCNQAFWADPFRVFFRWKNVTCKNCLKQRRLRK